MATRAKPAGEGEGGSGGEGEGDKPVTRAELDKFKEDMVKVLDEHGAKSAKGGGDPQTQRGQESEARESVEDAFARLRAKEEHDAHHAALKAQQEKAAQRESERAKRTAPVETGKTRNRLWDY